MKKNRRHQSGQATFEVTISLLAIIFVVVGILFFGGIGITSIKTLLLSREDAEQLALEADAGDRAGGDIGNWSYTEAIYRKTPNTDSITIPFLANDNPIGTQAGVSTDYFTDRTYSLGEVASDQASNHPAAAGLIRYRFQTPLSITGMNYSDRMSAGNSFDLANLKFSRGRLPDEITRNGNEEIYTLHRMKDSQELKNRLANAGLFDFRDLSLLDWRSNTVAFPAMKPLD